MTERPNKAMIFPKRAPEFNIGRVALGNMTEYTIATARTTKGYLVAIEGKGCFEFPRSYVHKSYAQEKLNLGPGDCGNVADFINDQLGLIAERQGQYNYPDLLAD